MTDKVKLDTIRQVIVELGDDPEFWTLEDLDAAINVIDDVIDPETPHAAPFFHAGGSITDDGLNVVPRGWYFWDEAGLYMGEYDTRDECLVAQQEYTEGELG